MKQKDFDVTMIKSIPDPNIQNFDGYTMVSIAISLKKQESGILFNQRMQGRYKCKKL